MDKKKLNKKNLSDNLKRLAEINAWLENSEDPEEALQKVKEAENIVKTIRIQLKEIENEFSEIKTNFENSVGENNN